MKATYIPTRPPTTDVTGPEEKVARETFESFLQIFCEVKSLPEGIAKDKGIQSILALDPTKLWPITSLLGQLQRSPTPEKLAACLARYSRSNEGIEKILKDSADKSPDGIFTMIDYGHASIGGLTGGIGIAVDGISMLLAYKLFEAAQMADGQESSTRYIELSPEGLVDPNAIGIPPHLQTLWSRNCQAGYELYKITKTILQNQVQDHPETARIPEKAKNNPKVRDRMLKNYALDRCRYFLPMAAKTNVAIVASARIWADILKQTEALQWPEAIEACAEIRKVLEVASPNLIRHSHADTAAIASQFQLLMAGSYAAALRVHDHRATCACHLETSTTEPQFQRFNTKLDDALETRGSRYSIPGTAIKRMTVSTEWSAIALAELRDLNRHRTGHRFTNMAPMGFYIPTEIREIIQPSEGINQTWNKFLKNYETIVQTLARQSGPGMQAYGYFLGTQVPFEHVQQADKFLYEVELRTGLGAHFRYAEHLTQAAELFFAKHPETKPYIQLGDAEPE
jgi:thymidylate synthase ThyX